MNYGNFIEFIGQVRFFRAKKLEKFLGTPAHIYYKYEGNNPSGSHKLNTALAQAYYNKKGRGKKPTDGDWGPDKWGNGFEHGMQLF